MKVGGKILWNVTPICETSQIYNLMGRRPMKDVLGNHVRDRIFHLVHRLSITLQLRRTSQESINLERKSYLDCSSDTHCTQGIHDRFIRDPEFRSRMIENHRDEEHCRRWDALVDEDHTHQLTTSIRANGGFIQISKVLILCH